jgi:hypothetical protein
LSIGKKRKKRKLKGKKKMKQIKERRKIPNKRLKQMTSHRFLTKMKNRIMLWKRLWLSQIIKQLIRLKDK